MNYKPLKMWFEIKCEYYVPIYIIRTVKGIRQRQREFSVNECNW